MYIWRLPPVCMGTQNVMWGLEGVMFRVSSYQKYVGQNPHNGLDQEAADKARVLKFTYVVENMVGALIHTPEFLRTIIFWQVHGICGMEVLLPWFINPSNIWEDYDLSDPTLTTQKTGDD